MTLDPLLPPQSSMPDVLASIALISTLLVAWWLTGRALRSKDDLTPQVARRWTANVRNGLVLVAIVGLLMIWAPQLRTFALSVTAVAVAIVIATKELILCLSGSAFRTFTRAYTIGDLIEIGEHRGEVVDISLLSTRIRAVDARAGSIRASRQSVMIPHSLLFSQPARVLSKGGSTAEHVFTLTFETGFDLFSRHGELEEAAAAAMTEAGFAPTTGDQSRPRIAFMTSDIGRIRLEVSVGAAPGDAGAIENAITTAIGSFVYSKG